MEKVRVSAKNGIYDIIIGENVLDDADKYLEKYLRKLYITDDIVYEIYKENFNNCNTFVIKSGEESKCHENLLKIYEKMAEARLTREDALVAVGGGVMGDLAGFAAASYKRGIKFIQVPTTLLAQVDSSVGGKVAVNLPSGKNMVGAFYQPELVIADTNVLKTLDKRQYSAGMAEIIKYGFIADEKLFDYLLKGDIEISKVIKTCCEIKAKYVGEDPFDTGIRMELNYGHTMGHVIETVCGYGKYLHGEAVAIGMVYAAIIGESLGISPKGLAEKTMEINEKFSLPSDIDKSIIKEGLDILLLDKKASGNEINFILIDKIGHAVHKKLTVEKIRSILA